MNAQAGGSTDSSTTVGANRTAIADWNARPPLSNESSASSSGSQTKERKLSEPARPTSAPGGNAPPFAALIRDSANEDSDRESTSKKPKPLLQRSKSDYGPRGDDSDAKNDSDSQDWGARHGFEDHYASEEYVSQLANVSRCFLMRYLSPGVLQALGFVYGWDNGHGGP